MESMLKRLLPHGKYVKGTLHLYFYLTLHRLAKACLCQIFVSQKIDMFIRILKNPRLIYPQRMRH